jgi:polyhydroxybutyrate depolymerase
MPKKGAAAGDIVVVPHLLPNDTEWQFSGNGTDASYVHTLIGSLESSLCINRDAVFLTGFSAGAAFTIVYACTHKSEIRAIATVAVDFQLGCTSPMPILAFHGTADPEVPYQNGALGLSLPGVKVRGTQLNMGDWARLDNCRGRTVQSTVGTQVRQQVWKACVRDSQVVLFTVEGGGHTWPGADPGKGFGLTTQQVSATNQILKFFSGYGVSR